MPIVRAEVLQNTESGPVALLGNGPSLKLWPLDRLNCPAIGINLSYGVHRSKYHSFVTGSMVSQMNRGLILHCDAIFFPFRYQVRLTEPFVKSYREGKIVPVLEMTKQRELQWNLAQGSDATFGGIFAIQVALFLGFTELYLLGYDEHNKDDYFNGNQTQIANREEIHLFWYPLAKKTTDKLGVKVFVCNRDSAIRIWPFTDPPLTDML